MKPVLEEYGRRYEHAELSRQDGVLTVRFHSEGDSLIWGARPHEELGYLFADIGADPENRVIVLTGTGDDFLASLDESWVGGMTPEKWDRIHANGRRLLRNLLEIEVPVVAAINGPTTVHAEIPLLCDIIVMSETAYFRDAPHFRFDTVPGDGVHIVFPLLLGPNRGRHFLLTGARIEAQEALQLGLVGEVRPQSEVLPAALDHAQRLARHHDVILRATREALVHDLRKRLLDSLGHGLALEGLGAYATWP